jgi:hypothetical protein
MRRQDNLNHSAALPLFFAGLKTTGEPYGRLQEAFGRIRWSHRPS